MKHGVTRIILAAALSAATMACDRGATSAPTQQPTPQIDVALQAQINAGVTLASRVGCALIPQTDRQNAISILDKVESAAAISPTTAWNLIVTLAEQPPLAYVWGALHGVLDPIGQLTSQSWTVYAQQAVLSAARGCREGLGG